MTKYVTVSKEQSYRLCEFYRTEYPFSFDLKISNKILFERLVPEDIYGWFLRKEIGLNGKQVHNTIVLKDTLQFLFSGFSKYHTHPIYLPISDLLDNAKIFEKNNHYSPSNNVITHTTLLDFTLSPVQSSLFFNYRNMNKILTVLNNNRVVLQINLATEIYENKRSYWSSDGGDFFFNTDSIFERFKRFLEQIDL